MGMSRAKRLDAVIAQVGECKSEVEMLRDELQEWLDNMPENLQSGQKASELEDAIQNLEEMLSSLEDAENASVDFPGMF